MMLKRLKTIIIRFNQRRDLYTLLITFALLTLAIINPHISVKHNIYSYFLVVDITQSMNTADMGSKGKPMTRIEHAKQLMHETISSLPCGTKVGIGMFSGVNVVALYLPIDVCANFASLQDTIDHINWRSAWTADSRVREGLLSSAQVMNNFSEPAQLVYLTDGEEAPKLHAFNTRDLSTFQGADGWLVVGVGSEAGGSIPKFDERNQQVGYWSHESMQLAPGAAPIAAAGILQRKSDLAESPQDRYVSKLAESYLQATAKEIGASYVRGESLQTLLSAMKKQKPARHEWAPLPIGWILASLAGLTLLSAYIPWRRFKLKRNKAKKKPLEQEDFQAAFSNVSTESVS